MTSQTTESFAARLRPFGDDEVSVCNIAFAPDDPPKATFKTTISCLATPTADVMVKIAVLVADQVVTELPASLNAGSGRFEAIFTPEQMGNPAAGDIRKVRCMAVSASLGTATGFRNPKFAA